MESADLSKRATRKWPGLGKNVFDIDFADLSDAYKIEGDEEKAPGTPVQNEISHEVEVKNTGQHKAIVKARNEYYEIYKVRF